MGLNYKLLSIGNFSKISKIYAKNPLNIYYVNLQLFTGYDSVICVFIILVNKLINIKSTVANNVQFSLALTIISGFIHL